jgi:hypothetical protein
MPAPRTCLGFSSGEVRGQSLPGGEEFLLVDDVVSIEHRPRFVAGEQHGDPGVAAPGAIIER